MNTRKLLNRKSTFRLKIYTLSSPMNKSCRAIVQCKETHFTKLYDLITY